jgi:3-methyl-2-oxobutanoate hydroxymethyltransferase
MITVPEFKKRKEQKSRLSMITCYDASFAKILAESPIDILLIGDSSAMVMQGFDSTIHSDVESIAYHTAAVARGTLIKPKFIVADMPFLSTRKSREFGMLAAEKLLKAGAHAVKIEGVRGNEDLIGYLTESGIPVMGHLGLTPQFVNAFGGMKVQAKTPEEQDVLLNDAKKFEELGAFSLVLECVPSSIAKKITAGLKIPTIGIGAGADCDGQVLVLQDLLGFNPGFKPKFLKTYLNSYELFQGAFARFHEEVQGGAYPTDKESYSS